MELLARRLDRPARRPHQPHGPARRHDHTPVAVPRDAETSPRGEPRAQRASRGLPAQVTEVAFDARRHGAAALEALHGALSFRGAAADDLLFAAAAPPRREVVKEDRGAFCARARAETKASR